MHKLFRVLFVTKNLIKSDVIHFAFKSCFVTFKRPAQLCNYSKDPLSELSSSVF
uniref:Uncharacterized protein n=1 Tax=Ciona intestinalis TaxID=7719 RepID=H2XZB3_CIOIN